MNKFKNFWRHVWWAVRYGEWHCGYYSKKEWPARLWIHCGLHYYDGWWFGANIGGFSIGCEY